MFVILPVVISVTLGILCGTWISVLPFSIIAFIGALGSSIAIWISGYGIGYALIDFIGVAVSLQAGYVVGILGLFLVSKIAPKPRASFVHYKPKHDTSLS